MMQVQIDHEMTWENRDKGRACSYCGSMHPDDFFAAIAAGHEIVPTDKSYKVYVVVPNPQAGKLSIVSVTNAVECPAGYHPVTPEIIADAKKLGWSSLREGDFVQFAPEPVTAQRKFYFQHLSDDEKKRFIELLNAQKINIGYPGHFYVLPFFCRRLPAV